jgi:histone H3/H4
MREMGLFDPKEGKPCQETRAEIESLNRDLRQARIERLCRVMVTLDMPEHLVLEVLDARLTLMPEDSVRDYCRMIQEEGGPSPRALRKYVRDVLDRGFGLRVDQRIRPILATIDGAGAPAGKPPREPELFHSGTLPPAAIRRMQREAAEEEEADRRAEEAAIAAIEEPNVTEEDLDGYKYAERINEMEMEEFPEHFP